MISFVVEQPPVFAGSVKAEAGVLRTKNMYDTISIDAREKLDEAAKELGLW